ncbi:hypothetical protein ACERNI_11665 [Camelimonas sp. ID_303_24]
MIEAATCSLTLPGKMLRRGFWLYVWKVEAPGVPAPYLYVGRTGDNSSPYASAPYTRMGQHLGSVKNQNALRQHLSKLVSDLECCTYHLIAHGPIFPEIDRPVCAEERAKLRSKLFELHRPWRDIVGAYERDLANALRDAGYNVLNSVVWKHAGAREHWPQILNAFSEHFPRLKSQAS